MITLLDLIICFLVWLIIFAAVVISDRRQPQSEPDDDPCDTCLRWCECHGADVENCPLCIDWRRV